MSDRVEINEIHISRRIRPRGSYLTANRTIVGRWDGTARISQS